MKKFVTAAFLLALASPAFAKTHDYQYPMPCATLWPAVKDTLRNSGKYVISSMDPTDFSASYVTGSSIIGAGKRQNSLILNAKDGGCDMQVQTSYSGFTNDDAGDFKKRVDASVAKLGAAAPVTPGTPPATPGTTPDAKPTTAPPAR